MPRADNRELGTKKQIERRHRWAHLINGRSWFEWHFETNHFLDRYQRHLAVAERRHGCWQCSSGKRRNPTSRVEHCTSGRSRRLVYQRLHAVQLHTEPGFVRHHSQRARVQLQGMRHYEPLCSRWWRRRKGVATVRNIIAQFGNVDQLLSRFVILSNFPKLLRTAN